MTYKSTHPPGAKTILLALGLLLGPLVAACSGGTAATAEGDSTPTTSSTPSFAPVDFDKDAPGFKFFDACNDLSVEDYEQLELKPAEIRDYDPSIPFSGCSFHHSGDGMADAKFGVVSDLSSQEKVLAGTEAIETHFESKTKGAYFHSSDSKATENSCMASVPTQGGRLGIFAFTAKRNSFTREELCQLSDELLLKFIEKAERQS